MKDNLNPVLCYLSLDKRSECGKAAGFGTRAIGLRGACPYYKAVLRFAVQEKEKFWYSRFMKKDDKQPGFVHIGNVIDGVLKNYRAKPDFELTEIWRLWDEAVGAAIAQNARPAAFKGQLLIVHVISSTWIHQLQFLKSDLMAKINAALGKQLIQEIKFKIGPLR